jgi:Leucine-rich repeat (LRR) protein
MLRIGACFVILGLLGTGCFPTKAPEKMVVYKSVDAAVGARGPYYLNLDNQGLKKLPTGMMRLDGVARLSLRGNQLANVADLGSLQSLSWLDLGNAGLTKLSGRIGSLQNLSTLYLSDNKLRSLPPEIGALSSLVYINLDRNQFKSLPPEIGRLKNLKWLRLNNNQLTSLPKEICELENLRRIYLRYNKLTALPEGVEKLKKLEWLLLEGNNIPDGERERIRKLLPDCNIEFGL